MTTQSAAGGTFTLPNSSITLNRMGYGAMKLAGPEVWGPPADIDGAVAILREAIASGVCPFPSVDAACNPYLAFSVILAAGHSAREIFELLHGHKVRLEAKPFAMGVRIEHPQPLIDRIQYRAAFKNQKATPGEGRSPGEWRHPKLPAAAPMLLPPESELELAMSGTRK